VVIRVNPSFKRLSGIIFILKFLPNFINKIKYLNRIKPYIYFLIQKSHQILDLLGISHIFSQFQKIFGFVGGIILTGKECDEGSY
jgi:hypothetical protein